MLRTLSAAVWATIALFVAMPAAAQSPFGCAVSISAEPLRSESMAELLGDVVLDCKGGNPGQRTRLEVLVAATAPITSRDLPSAANLTLGLVDALLLVDDPPAAKQIVCVPAAGESSCPDSLNANIFQGRRIEDNALAFQSVSITAPGDGATRRLRIVNLRGDLTRTRNADDPEPQISVLVYSNGRAILNATLQLDPPRPSYKFSVRTDLDGEVAATKPALIITRSQLKPLRPDLSRSLLLKFTETTKHGFRRRNFGTTAFDATMLLSQDAPGIAYQTETGFYNSRFPETNGLNTAGKGDSGTRFRVILSGIPKGVGVWISARDVAAGTTNYLRDSPRALMTYADTSGPIEFNRVFPEPDGFSQVYVEGGTASATWEVVSADSNAIESLSFAVALCALDGTPGLGSATVTAEMVPAATTRSYPQFARQEGVPAIAFQVVNSVEAPPITVLPAASLTAGPVAPGSIASIFGERLAGASLAAPSVPAATLGETGVAILDATGVKRDALLFSVSPSQLNVLIPAETRLGPAAVQVLQGGSVIASGSIIVASVAPGIFTAAGDGSGPPVGETSGSTPLALFSQDLGKWEAAPVDVAEGQDVYLTILGSGWRNRTSLSNVQARVGFLIVPVVEAGESDGLPGVDRVKLGPVPAGLRAQGLVELRLTIEGKTANPVTLRFR